MARHPPADHAGLCGAGTGAYHRNLFVLGVDVMRHRGLIFIALGLCGLIALVFARPYEMVAPGPLMPAHAQLTTNCFACHAPFTGASPERCMACHKLADIGLRTTKGVTIARTVKSSFHQDLIEQDCMACHSGTARPARATPAASPSRTRCCAPRCSSVAEGRATTDPCTATSARPSAPNATRRSAGSRPPSTTPCWRRPCRRNARAATRHPPTSCIGR